MVKTKIPKPTSGTKFQFMFSGFFIKEISIRPMLVGSIFKELPSCKYIGYNSVGFVKGDFIIL